MMVTGTACKLGEKPNEDPDGDTPRPMRIRNPVMGGYVPEGYILVASREKYKICCRHDTDGQSKTRMSATFRWP